MAVVHILSVAALLPLLAIIHFSIDKKMHLPNQNFAFTAIVFFGISMFICGFFLQVIYY